LFLCFLAGCGSKAESDQAGFEQDKAAATEVRRIAAGLGRTQSVAQSDLDLLKTVHAKYPAAAEVRQTLQAALQARQDWEALEKLLTETPEAERTQSERVYLGKVYLKLGRYKEARLILEPLATAAPQDLEINSLAGQALYFEGRYEAAARVFDRVWDAIIATNGVDEIMMRGMIYFYQGDKGRAIETLKKTVELNPDYFAGHNALSRVYAAQGDAAQAADETRRIRLNARARDLESAFAARRYEECVRIAQEMLRSADETQKPMLYEYIGQAYQALGKQAEAQSAFQEAARLRTK
jgi:predicted Zn-dependent protease